MEALSFTSYFSLASTNAATYKSQILGMPVAASNYRNGDTHSKANKSIHCTMYEQRDKCVRSTVKSEIDFTYSGRQPTSVVEKHSDGIGIVKFLQGKTLLITGGTGLLGKVFLEKILRTAPEVHKIFVLMKAKDKEDAVGRLKNEIIYSKLFEHLKQIHGESYEAFMLSKLDPVVGNLCESNLGLYEDAVALMAKEIDIIINSAANTSFDERYDRAVDMNIGGPTRLMGFAKLCPKLKVFVQVSTAYVNGKRQGRIEEKHFCMGESIEKHTKLNIEDEMRLILESKKAIVEDIALLKKMKELARQRANKFGWQDVYVFTKAMGEMTIESLRKDTSIPMVIMRPSIVGCPYRDPLPGWIQGNRMMDPVIQHYGKGNLLTFLADPDVALDVIPVDMVVNAILAAIAKHGEAGKPESNIYQVASSVANPFFIRDLFAFLFKYFDSSPLIDSTGSAIRVAPIEYCSSMEDFSSKLYKQFTSRSDVMLSEKLEIRRKKMVEQIKQLAKLYEPYTFYGGRFDISNTKTLMGFMSEEERQQFGFDIESLDWEDYIKNVHIPGLRKYVMKGR